MNWIPLTTEAQLQELIERSASVPQVIFRHSTRCAISSMAKSRLERASPPEGPAFYFLDLIAYRPLSRKVEQVFGIEHESPQLLLIKNGACVYHESHSGINMEEIKEKANAA